MDISSEIASQIGTTLLKALPLFLPFALWSLWVPNWVSYVRKKFLSEQNYILLQITPPSDITKSPLAMELVLIALHNTAGEATWIDRYWKGKSRSDFSLEIISIEGDLHFIIRTREGMRRYVETQLYSQFPGIEIQEADDYTAGVELDPNVNSLFGTNLALTKPDPYPIKTYVDWGLDKETDEEYKIDPLVPLLEFMGGLGPGHQIWIQYIVRGHSGSKKVQVPLRKKLFSNWDKREDEYELAATNAIADIREESITYVEENGMKKALANQTKGQQQKIAAIEHAMTKPAFDVGVRAIYIAHKDVFDGANIGGILNNYKQFSSKDLNGFRPDVGSSSYPWDDPFKIKDPALWKEYLEHYKNRSYFYDTKRKHHWWRPTTHEPMKAFILNTEELATLFHFPGRVSTTPTLERVDSRKATPPANLPI